MKSPIERKSLMLPGMKKTADERFWVKVKQDGDCWVWTATKNAPTEKNGGGGYGGFRLDGRMVKAHIYAYKTMVGEIPDGLELDHLCRNRACVNPYHADPVPKAINLQRAVYRLRERTHCKYDHEFTPENTYWYKPSSGDGLGRACKTCRAAAAAAYESRRKIRV